MSETIRMKLFAATFFLLALPLAADEHFGAIAFANSGKPEAQEAFLRGVLLLHNFAYPQAARAFEEAERIDPNFALAYWGEAMTYNHPIWYEVDLDRGRAAVKRGQRAAGSGREKMWIDAVAALYGEGDKAARDAAYEAAMARLAAAHPNDVEARVFHALAILGTVGRDEVDARKRIRAAALLEPILAERRDHPGALHYLIHAYDDPLHAPLGLRAAQRYAAVASGAPHALHMPSHIFVQLGMWPEAAKANEQAWALSKEWVVREHAASDKRDLHSLSWLQYVYLQQRRAADARRLLDEVAPKEGEGMRERHTRESMQARYAIESGDWGAFDFAGTHEPAAMFARGMRAIAANDAAEAERAAKELAGMGHDRGAVEARTVETMVQELRASMAMAHGDTAAALRLAAEAAQSEERLGVPSGPPDTFKPAHELYGELLLRAGKKKEAAEQFRIELTRTPNRAASVTGLAIAEQ
jgi:tetratricopeptide (TPR) repeat protein